MDLIFCTMKGAEVKLAWSIDGVLVRVDPFQESINHNRMVF